MQPSFNIFCFSLNYKNIDKQALLNLESARLKTNKPNIEKFKKELGFDISEVAFIVKCNAVMVIGSYQGDISSEHLKKRVIDAWNKYSKKEIISFSSSIKSFYNENAFKYIAECSVGLHSVTLGDSQVSSQILKNIQVSIDAQKKSYFLIFLKKELLKLVKHIKKETSLLSGNTSLERIASKLLHEKFDVKDIHIIGYGQTGKLMYKILSKELGYEVKVANRTLLKIKKDSINILQFDSYEKIVDCDCIIICIENSNQTKEYIKKVFTFIKKKDIVIIDMSSPSFSIPNQKKYKKINLTSLSIIANENIKKRRNNSIKARQLINNESSLFFEKIKKYNSLNYIKSKKNEPLSLLKKNQLRIIKIRNDVYKKIRSIMEEKNFIEITTPYVVAISTDPPKVDKGSAVSVDWNLSTKAFLRQSNQIYKQIVSVSGIEKLYEIGPFWRSEAEKSYRHLQETIGLDIEMQNPKSTDSLYRLAYEIIQKTNEYIQLKYKLKKYLYLPKFNKVPIITYGESILMLNEKGYVIKLGEDLGVTGEAKLGSIIKNTYGSDAVIITDYPDTIKKFYTKGKEKGLTCTFDIIIGGWELVSGAIRETDRKKIEKSMKISGINSAEYNFYLSVIEDAVDHGGFCLGLDRLISKILDQEIIEESTSFPRTSDKLIP